MQQKFLVNGVPVFVRNLPSGDMAVWHPYNPEVQQIVEPICRGCGYWQPEYKNWVIKSNCVTRVLAALGIVGRTL